MRKTWPLIAALVLGMAAPLPAQFTVTGAKITNGKNTNAAGSAVPTIGMTQMIPSMNFGKALSSPFGGVGKNFNIARMLPSFSGLKNSLFPVRSPQAQFPPGIIASPR